MPVEDKRRTVRPAVGKFAEVHGRSLPDRSRYRPDTSVFDARLTPDVKDALTDQAFAHDVSLAAVKRTDGTVSTVADLGFDRNTDDSAFSIGQTLVRANNAVAWVLEQGAPDWTSTESRLEFDLASGAQTAAWDTPMWELTTASGECSDDDIATYTSTKSGRNLAGATTEDLYWATRLTVGTGDRELES